MPNALEATVRGIQSPVREQTRRRPAPKKGRTQAPGRPPVFNFSYFKERHETGQEPPFRKRKRTPAELANDSYVESLKDKIDQEEITLRRPDDTSFIEDMSKKFGIKIEDKDTKRRRKIKELNEEATIPPQIELNINSR